MLVCLYSFHIRVLETFELGAFRLSFYFVLKYWWHGLVCCLQNLVYLQLYETSRNTEQLASLILQIKFYDVDTWSWNALHIIMMHVPYLN